MNGSSLSGSRDALPVLTEFMTVSDASADDTPLQFAHGSFQHSGPRLEFIRKGMQPAMALMIFVFAALFCGVPGREPGELSGARMAASRCTEYDDVGEPCMWGNVRTCGMESSAVVDGSCCPGRRGQMTSVVRSKPS